jgi:hypothetical protein
VTLRQYIPFVFPEGCRPNISDTTTFETNVTIDIDHMLNYTLANDSMWEEVIQFEDATKRKTDWEDMMRFGISEA